LREGIIPKTPTERINMGAKRFKDSYEMVKVRGEKRDFSKEITKQERDFDNPQVHIERPTRKVREVVIINGKKFYVV
jgi:hypothetical protein